MHMIFSLIQRYLLSRAGSTIVGLFVVISLIWFAGPAVGLNSVIYRIAIIGLIVVIALAVWLMRRAIASSRGSKLQDEIGGNESSKAASKKLEIQLLKEKMNEAISSLKSSELGARYRGNAALYALPWYMIIGASAAGKSTLLRQSGLHFPYASDDDIHVKGYGGTRNCDWWFSDQAIFLDTAGRYTTEEDDRDEWLSFLAMLRKHRKKMPINGVLVAVSLDELLTRDSEGLEWHVKVIRNRISELIQELGLVFPVYLVFTKSDLLKGFESFFDDLGENERNQVWGAYLYDKQDGEDNVSEIFRQSLNDLYVRLCDMRLRKVSMQRNLARKSELFDFPSQFGSAAEKLNKFINLLFKENPYQETPQFAGVYFTSATQGGTPIERLIGNLRQAFGHTKQGEDSGHHKQRPFFIKHLFTEVIFRIQGGARANRKKITWNRGVRTVAVLLSLFVVSGSYVVLSGSYATNTYLLNRGVTLAEEVVNKLHDSRATVKQRYEALANVQKHLEELNAIDADLPWVKQVALYRADEQKGHLQRLIDASMYHAYWVPVTREVERRLDALGQRWAVSNDSVQEQLRPDYYETLKLYLQLTRKDHFDFDVVLESTKKVWRDLVAKNQVTDDTDLSYIEMFARRYLEAIQNKHEIQLVSNEQLIDKARKQLYSTPDPVRLYSLLVNNGKSKWHDLSIKNFVTGQGKGYLISNKTVAGIYTSNAWYDFVKKEIQNMAAASAHGDWVMEDTTDKAKASDKQDTGIPGDLDHQSGSKEVVKSEVRPDRESSSEISQRKDTHSHASPKDRLKGDALAAYLEREVRALYFSDYADEWLKFLHSFKYKLPRKLADKSMAMMYLSSYEGPIAQLSQAIADNIRVYESRPVPEKAVTSEVELKHLTAQDPNHKPVPELAAAFKDLQRFSAPQKDSQLSKPISQYLDALAQVYREIDTLAASVDVKRDSERFASGLLSGQSTTPKISNAWIVTTTLVNSVKRPTRPILRSLLSPPISMAWSGIIGQATSDLQQEWLTSVVRPYTKLIAGKFPFSATGTDAALADVAEFYHPDNGILWKFTKEKLSPYIHKTAGGWKPRKWLGIGVNFSQEFLHGLSEAQKVTDALYTKQDSSPNMTFYLQPDPSTNLREMQIESNGQLFRYRNGPQVWQRFDWPGDMNQIGARVMGIADDGRSVGELRADGPWGLFHLLTLANIVKTSGTEYKTRWDLPSSDGGSVSVSFKLRADRQDNIFNFKKISAFELPQSIFRSDNSRLAAY